MAEKKNRPKRSRGFSEKAVRYADLSPRARAARDVAVEEGLADMRAGRVIPAEEVEAWIESWDTPNELPMPRARKR